MPAPSTRSATLAGQEVLRRISWSAVLAGVVLAGALQLLLNLLGLSIGLWTIDLDASQAFGIAAGVWWLATALIAVFAGSWAASHLAGIPRRLDGMIHGLLVWSLGSLLMVMLVSTAAGAVLGGAAGMLTRAAQQTGNLIEQIAPDAASAAAKFAASEGVPVADITAEIGESLTGPEAEATRREIQQLLTRAVGGQNVQSPQFRQQLVDLLVTRGEVERARAERLADSAVAQLAEAQRVLSETGQEVKETTEDVAHSTGKAALWAFLALLAGALAAGVGGRAGTPTGVVRSEALTSIP